MKDELNQNEHNHEHGCCCHNHGSNHHHEHEHECSEHQTHEHNHSHGGNECGCHHHHEEKESPVAILIGAGLFLIGLFTTSIPFLSIVLFVAAYLILGWEVLTNAAKNIVKGHVFDENFLMSIATLSAFAIREFPEAAVTKRGGTLPGAGSPRRFGSP